ncbi:MAG: EAL domain-containing protein, partial [Erysipelotrichaceae bacterium]
FLLFKNHKHKKSLREMDRSKYVDSLTGIGNYLYLKENYERMVLKENYSLFYLAYIGIDSHIIEKYAGIDFLYNLQKKTALSLNNSVDKEDVLSVTRDGTFVLLFQSASDMSAREYIGQLLSKINADNDILETYEIGYSAGLYRLEKANMSFETVYRNAQFGYDMAVSKKKEVYVVSKDVLELKEKTQKLQQRLKQALDNDEFDIYLQYIVDNTGQIAGGEVLSRWYNREFGLTKPNMYIEALIDSGLIDEFDFYVFDKVCALLESYKNTDKSNLWISCNFTRQTFSRKDFEERLNKIIKIHDFDHHKLTVELTEDCLISDHEQAYKNIMVCKGNGFKIALDDLGSGFSSISDLCDYPIDLIKMDRYIVIKSVEERGFAFLDGFIELAHDLGIKVLCEGVESSLQNEMVLKASTDYIQGYFYARVLPIDEADSFFLKYNNINTNQGVDNGTQDGDYQELPRSS